MNTEERKAAIRDMINSMIKSDPETAEKHFHDVLASKTRERLNPPGSTDDIDTDLSLETNGEE